MKRMAELLPVVAPLRVVAVDVALPDVAVLHQFVPVVVD